MVPTSFAESNGTLDPPRGMEDCCDPLAVAYGKLNEMPVVVSCWKLTKEELEEINRTGRVWLVVVGETQPPVALQVKKPMGD